MIDSYKTKGLRKKLVKELRTLGIKDEEVLKAIGDIPRHFFLDSAFTEHSYKNKAFPIGAGQTISHPYTVAFQTELLEIKPKDKVLEIGTGSGYQTTVLSKLECEIWTIERISELSKKAKKICSTLNVKANYIVGDGSLGLPLEAPFDKIIVTAGAPNETETLINQLRPNGCLVIPVGDSDEQEILKIVKKNDGTITKESFKGFAFVPFVGKNAW